MQTYTLSQETGGGNTRTSSAAYFWAISLLFRAVVKTGSIAWELPESHGAVINHSRGDVFGKRSAEGEGMELAAERVSCFFQAPEGKKTKAALEE